MRILIALLMGILSTSGWSMGKPLVVCLEQESAPYSTESGGVDNDVALAVADGLGLPLIIHWYETEGGDEGNPALQVNALLSAGKCELAGGFALAKNSFAHPREQSYPLETGPGERRSVSLKPLAPSLPYHSQVFTLIWASTPADPAPESLDDLGEITLLAQENSVADLILMAHRGGQLRDSIRHVKEGGGSLLTALADGEADAGWLAQHHFEQWKRQHPRNNLQPSGLIHDFTINLGFAALKSNAQLLERVDEQLDQLVADGDIAAIFERHQLTYVEPESSRLMPPLSTRLLGDKKVP
ncbi:MAG: transporter substrate-binding domain-containing protein [Gammaproteobacteria bacterium]